MKKLITALIILSMTAFCYADQVTDNYALIIPNEGARDVFEILSNDIITIDTVLGILSSDMAGLDVTALTVKVNIISSDMNNYTGPLIIVSDDVATLKSTQTIISADVGVNKTHVAGDGSDHADVATNTTHSTGDGSDHADVATNTAKVTNATHTGEATGSGALTLQSAAITNRSDVTITAADVILYSDVTDSDNLKKDTIQGIIDLAGSGSGRILQTAMSQDSTMLTGTTAVAYDDTIPLNSEGDKYMELTFKPTASTSSISIDVVLYGSSTDTDTISALFRDDDTFALAAVVTNQAANLIHQHQICFGAALTTDVARTYKVRSGGPTGTYTFNGTGGSRLLGGVLYSTMRITEVSS